jgi:hypothetical protein
MALVAAWQHATTAGVAHMPNSVFLPSYNRFNQRSVSPTRLKTSSFVILSSLSMFLHRFSVTDHTIIFILTFLLMPIIQSIIVHGQNKLCVVLIILIYSISYFVFRNFLEMSASDIETTAVIATETMFTAPSLDLTGEPPQPKSHLQKKTRHASAVFGLGNGITELDAKITGSRLPTSMQVLRCLMYHIKNGVHESRTRFQSAKIVLSKILPFYQKANIPMISKIKACEKLLKLIDENAKIRAIPIKRRSTAKCVAKVQKMEEKLSETFALWPADVEQLVKNTEDLQFLQSMKSDRAATFGSHDKVLSSKLKRREKRMILEQLRRERNSTMYESNTAVTGLANTDIDNKTEDSDDISVSEHESADDTVPSDTPRSHHRSARTGTQTFVPHDIVKRPKLVALATRLKMTPTQQAAYTAALIA